jgi:1,2-diacylglycerol 3-alpha-glucosyltransferase
MISGAAIVVQKLAEGMVSRGHSSLVIAASDRGETYTLEFGNLKTIRLKSITNPKRAYQKFVPISFRRIFKELKDFQPEIIHTHDVLSLGIAGIFVGHALDIPVIATIHQLPWFISAYLPAIPGLKHLIERSLWSYSQWLNKQCETMIVPTSTIARIIERRGGFVTQVISNGVDLTHFNPMPSNHLEEKYLRRKYNIDDKCSIILHVGRLDLDKNVDLVIKAAAKAMRKSDANLLVVGDGKCRKSLIQLAKKEGVRNRSKFPGFIEPKTDLPGIYRMADVFITASEIETQGLVVLEAMASGLPVAWPITS